ncbi:MAG: ABC transporter ATP-binding protein [Clostridia bacterium]|nr:ABC transporter ATP-binding protein [Clostridia bacterium]
MEDDIAIEITGLCKNYKMFHRKRDRLIETIIPKINRHSEFSAVQNLDLTIKKGEAIGILGRNGAGKSTLLKMITGVVTPSCGTIKVNGKISSLLELGTAFNMELTGIENIYQHGQVMGFTKQEMDAKKQEIINFADIGEHIHQPVKSYSSGMFARLAFACAINVDPDILIVDEVLSVGDMAFQLKCFKKFEEFKKQGKTLLFVTHSINDVLTNCTRAIIMENGRKTFDGPVKDGVNRYKKIIVGINPDEKAKDSNDFVKETTTNNEESWKEKFNQNPNLIEYGNKKAEVIDYGIFDEEQNPVSIFDNGETIMFKSKVKFNTKVNEPIFTLTIKDFSGKDILGTNSNIERVLTGTFNKGDIAIAEFTGKIPIAPGKYTVSFSCTKYSESGELEVLNRKYDALLIEVITHKDMVGLVRFDSNIKVSKIEK